MANVRKPYFEIVYEGVDITNDLEPDVLEITYEDAVEGESDEIRILVDDMDGKWKANWRSNNGDRLSLKMGYSKSDLLDCGSFEVDEVHYSGQPDTVEIRAIAIGVGNNLRQLKSRVFANQTIRQIAQKIADENGLDLVSYFPVVRAEIVQNIGQSINANKILGMNILRAHQDRESDLAFLNRIANKFGVSFNVRGTQMYFLLIYDLDSVRATNTVIHYDPETGGGNTQVTSGAIEMKSYRLKDCAEKIVKGVDVRYLNPKTGEAMIFPIDNDESYGARIARMITELPLLRILNRLQVYEDVENRQQAELVGAAAMYKQISRQVSGDIEMEGSTTVVSGTAFRVDGLGWLSGRYFVEKSRHHINRANGYTTRAEVKLLDVTASSQ